MSDGLLFALVALSAFRVWRLWATDVFPPIIAIRERFEAWVDRRHGDAWAVGVTCAWCSGAWISAVVVGAVWAFRPLPLPALWFAAVSAAVGLVAKWDEAI